VPGARPRGAPPALLFMVRSRVRQKAKPFFRWWLPRLGWPVAGVLAIVQWQGEWPSLSQASAPAIHPAVAAAKPTHEPMSPTLTPPEPTCP